AMFEGHSQPSSPEETIMDSEWDNDIVENSTGTSMKKRNIDNNVKTNNFYQKIIEDEGRD
ncbi:MAG: hypothetical protein EBZ62_07450, partial [Sphingobacteriia bacterium]|nr:hypothetical protein [Sphingobacteriia bacterium]